MNKYTITGAITVAAAAITACAQPSKLTPEETYTTSNVAGKLSFIETDLASITADGKLEQSASEFTTYKSLSARMYELKTEADKDPATKIIYDRIQERFTNIDAKFFAQQKTFIMYGFNNGAEQGMMPAPGQTIYLNGTPKDVSTALGLKLGEGVYALPNETGVDEATFQQRLAGLTKLDVTADPKVVGKLEALLPDNGPLSKANFNTYTDGIITNGEMLAHFVYVGLQLPTVLEVPEYAAPSPTPSPSATTSATASPAPSASSAASPSPSASPAVSPAPSASPAASPSPSASPATSPTAGTPGVTGGP